MTTVLKGLGLPAAAAAIVLTAASAGAQTPTSGGAQAHASAVAETPAAPSVLTGAYSEEQALRGRDIYYSSCLSCHGETMAGLDQATPLAGPQFSATWDGEPLQALVARIRTMPPDRPMSLSLADAVDVLTYILWYNGLPIGEASLDTSKDTLAAITFQSPPPQ